MTLFERLEAQARGGSDVCEWAVREIKRLTVDRDDYRRRRDEGTAVIRRLQGMLVMIRNSLADDEAIESYHWPTFVERIDAVLGVRPELDLGGFTDVEQIKVSLAPLLCIFTETGGEARPLAAHVVALIKTAVATATTELRAGLEKISVDGAEPGEIETGGDDPWPFDGWHTEDGYRDGKQAGRFEAGEIARAALGGVGVRGWPSHVCKFVELAEIFRGLWFSSVRGEIRWTVTFRRHSDGEIVETDYFDTPVKALDAAIGDCAAWGEDDA